MRRPNLVRSSAFRLTLLYMILFGTSVLGLLAFIYLSTVAVIDRQTEDTIDAEVRGLAEQYREQGLARLIDVIRLRSSVEGSDYYLLTDPNLTPLAGNLVAWPSDAESAADWIQLTVHRQHEGQVTSRDVRAQLFTLSGGYRLLVGRDTHERTNLRNIVIKALAWSLAAALALGLLGGIVLSRRMLRRVEHVARTSQGIMAGDLSRRIAVTGTGDEFDRLATSLNAMLDQIERLMTGMRLATDSLAHDLRSPLTRLRGRIELALRQPPHPARDREALADVLRQAEAALSTFDSLMKIAMAEAGIGAADLRIVDLAVIAGDAAELYEPVAEEREIRLCIATQAGAFVRAQPELLAQAITNLIDNAVKNTPSGGRIDVVCEARRSVVVLSVIDTGRGIPPADRERVLDRFVRLEESRSTPGAGLGLALVAAVARMHGARLTLEDAAPGLQVTLRFPLAREPDAAAKANRAVRRLDVRRPRGSGTMIDGFVGAAIALQHRPRVHRKEWMSPRHLSTEAAVPEDGGSGATAADRRAAALALVAQDHRRLTTRRAAIATAIEAGADAGSVRECIVGLIEAAREHFANEEWAMRTIGWPDYLAHKAEHARLLRDACDMLKNFDLAFTVADWPALATYFRHWLASHHARYDDALLASLAGRKRGSTPAA